MSMLSYRCARCGLTATYAGKDPADCWIQAESRDGWAWDAEGEGLDLCARCRKVREVERLPPVGARMRTQWGEVRVIAPATAEGVAVHIPLRFWDDLRMQYGVLLPEE